MEELLNIFFWIGTAAGGLLVILLLMSIFSSLDIGGDVDVDSDHPDGTATDHAPLGIVKTLLTFVSVSAFTVRAILLNTSWSWVLAALAALVSGLVAVLLLSWFFRWLLRNQESGNWHMWETEGKIATVYVPIPAKGKGRIRVKVDDNNREVTAMSRDGEAFATHDKVLVAEAKEDHVLVVPFPD